MSSSSIGVVEGRVTSGIAECYLVMRARQRCEMWMAGMGVLIRLG